MKSRAKSLFCLFFVILSFERLQKRGKKSLDQLQNEDVVSVVEFYENQGQYEHDVSMDMSDDEITLDKDEDENSVIILNGKRLVSEKIQVDLFLPTEEPNETVLICNRFVVEGVCDAQTQNHIKLKTIPQKYKQDKCIGTTFSTKSVASGPNTPLSLKCETGFHGFDSLKADREIRALAGVTLETFDLMLSILPKKRCYKISMENRLLLFLMKMKLGLSFLSLATLFRIHRTSASRIFFAVLNYLSVACKNFVFWPSKGAIVNTMPTVFKEEYPNCRVIIDCTEFRVEQPKNVDERIFLYSNYKKGYTVKLLVGCAPNGMITFVSKCYGGRTTDAQITVKSGFLDLLETDDVILADKGFPDIETILDEHGRGVLIVMPPFAHDNITQFSAQEVAETYKVARLRIHVERVIQRIRIYQIVSKFPISLLNHCDKIVFMACALTNLQPAIIQDNDDDENSDDNNDDFDNDLNATFVDE